LDCEAVRVIDEALFVHDEVAQVIGEVPFADDGAVRVIDRALFVDDKTGWVVDVPRWLALRGRRLVYEFPRLNQAPAIFLRPGVTFFRQKSGLSTSTRRGRRRAERGAAPVSSSFHSYRKQR
jgi:hypothetical protein